MTPADRSRSFVRTKLRRIFVFSSVVSPPDGERIYEESKKRNYISNFIDGNDFSSRKINVFKKKIVTSKVDNRVSVEWTDNFW